MTTRPKPWTRPGYLFSTPEMRAWMGGYVPRIAAEVSKPAEGKPASAEAAARLAIGRARGQQAVRGAKDIGAFPARAKV